MQALVLELVEGPTLADRIARGPIPVDEALPIARQIAEALEAAHEQGIIHRDLKPANIKLRPDGAVKVLDFGLAKVLEPVAVTGGDVTALPTITSPAMTQMGMILGTAAYMSPEQAKGRQADKRVAFQSDREGDLAIFSQPADGTGAVERLTKPDQGTSHVPESWSPKGDRFLYSVTKGSDVSLWTFSLQDREAMPFDVVQSSNPIGAVFSPDGRWVAYTTTERSRTTIFVQPFPATGAKHQLPAREGDNPHMVVWSPDGKELFYDPRAGGFEAVSVTTQPTFAFGNPVVVPRPFLLGPVSARRTYDITPGGKFVGLLPAGQKEFFTPVAPQIQVVLNWFEELKAKVPAGK